MTRVAYAMACFMLGCASTRPAEIPRAEPAATAKQCTKPAQPTANHRDLWKRAQAFERKHKWTDAERTLARAEELAPGFASYAFRRGYMLVKLAEETAEQEPKRNFYLRATTPLRRCIEVDPAYAECHHFLGEALLATHQTRPALEHYDAAIRSDPTVAYFYGPYADALISLKQYNAAEGVLNVAFRVLAPNERNRPNLYGLHILSFMVCQARDDHQGMVRAMEHALEVDRGAHPEMLFNLGSTYIIGTPPDPRGRKLLEEFLGKVCRGPQATKFDEQCHVAQALLQRSTSRP